MLMRRAMVEGETVPDTLAAVLRAEIDLTKLPADTPPKLRRLIQRCLERDPKRRLRDIGDAWIEFDAPEERAAPTRPVRAWTGWAAAALIAGAGVWVGLHPARPEAPLARFSVSQKGSFVNVSPDGTMVVWTEADSGRFRLMLRRMDQWQATLVAGSEGGIFPIFSPDGQCVAFSAANAVRKAPAHGGASVTLCDGNFQQGGAWLDDDTIVFRGVRG